jgi:hypothetical protein
MLQKLVLAGRMWPAGRMLPPPDLKSDLVIRTRAQLFVKKISIPMIQIEMKISFYLYNLGFSSLGYFNFRLHKS